MTDYKQLCAELATDLSLWLEYDGSPSSLPKEQDASCRLLRRARAALAEPDPETVGPTDEELSDLWSWSASQDQGPWPTQQHCFARAVLARWSSHPGSPDSSTPQPVPLSERLPVPENFNSKGECWWLHPGDEDCGAFWTLFDGHYRVGYTHWLPANALPLPS